MTVAFWVTLDGNYVGNPDIQVNNYDYDIEIAAFVNDECRMSTFLFSVAPTLPLVVMNSVHFTHAGEPVSFKMYIHSTGKEYDMCDFTTTVSENGCGSIDDPIILPFHTYFTKDITHYTGTSDHYYLIASPIGEVSPENVTDMHGMFHKCSSITNLDITNFNTSLWYIALLILSIKSKN